MKTVSVSCNKTVRFNIRIFIFVFSTGLLFFFMPVYSAFATSAIANTVMSFCAPEPTMPDVGSCSACHSTTNNRGPNDLTAAGVQSLAGNYAFFCPNAAPAPAPTPTTPTTPPPGSPGASPGTGGMGMGSGAPDDDDDDEGPEEDDDDDDQPPSA